MDNLKRDIHFDEAFDDAVPANIFVWIELKHFEHFYTSDFVCVLYLSTPHVGFNKFMLQLIGFFRAKSKVRIRAPNLPVNGFNHP